MAKIDLVIEQNDLILRVLGQLLEKYPNKGIRRNLIKDIDNIRWNQSKFVKKNNGEQV